MAETYTPKKWKTECVVENPNDELRSPSFELWEFMLVRVMSEKHEALLSVVIDGQLRDIDSKNRFVLTPEINVTGGSKNIVELWRTYNRSDIFLPLIASVLGKDIAFDLCCNIFVYLNDFTHSTAILPNVDSFRKYKTGSEHKNYIRSQRELNDASLRMFDMADDMYFNYASFGDELTNLLAWFARISRPKANTKLCQFIRKTITITAFLRAYAEMLSSHA